MPSPLEVTSAAQDGTISYEGYSSWADAHDAATGNAIKTTDSAMSLYADVAGYYYIRRAFLPFDTSALPDSPAITEAIITLRRSVPTGSGSAYLVQSTQAGAILALSDYDAVGTTALSDSPFNMADAAPSVTMNAAGIALISTSGNTYLALRCPPDFNDVPAQYVGTAFYSGDISTVSSRPKLTVTYTEGGTTTVPVWLLQHRSIGIGLGGPHA